MRYSSVLPEGPVRFAIQFDVGKRLLLRFSSARLTVNGGGSPGASRGQMSRWNSQSIIPNQKASMTGHNRRGGMTAHPGDWSSAVGALLLHERLHALVDLVHRQVFLVRRQGPDMAEWVCQGAGAVAVELILDWPKLFSPGGYRLAKLCVHVLDVEQDADRRAAERLRAAEAHVGVLVGHHDRRVADLDLGVADLAAGTGEAQQLPG